MAMTMPMSCSTSRIGDPERVRISRMPRPCRSVSSGSCRRPARRAGAAAAPCRAPGRPRRASGCRRAARRRACRSLSLELEEVGDLRDASPCALASRSPAAAADGGEEARARQVVAAEHEVLGHGLAADSAMFWKVRATPMPGDLVRAHPGQRCVAEADLALGGAVDPGQEVEHRRLAGAVRSDDRVDRARARR